MVDINLLPYRDALSNKKLQKHLASVVIVALLAGAGCGTAHFIISQKIATKKQKISALKSQIKALDKKVKEISDLKDLKKKFETKIEIIGKLKTKRFEHIKTFDTISRNKPKFLWINKLTKDNRLLAIEGVALNEQTVASFLAALEKESSLRKVELKFTEKTQEQKYELRKFKITLKTKRVSP